MDMIWHDNICIQFHKWKMMRDLKPIFFRNFTEIRHDHFSIFNIPENTFAIMHANSYIISAVG